KNVLVVAQQIELRARIARVLHSAGYGTELAGNQKRALELAARKDIQAAIVVHSTDLAGLGQKLRRKIPTTIVVGHRTDEIVRPGNSLQGTDAFPEDALDEQKLLDRLSQPAASPGSKRDETFPAPVTIEDCKLDLAGYTFVDGNGREVRLTRAEIALLTAFVDSPRRVLSPARDGDDDEVGVCRRRRHFIGARIARDGIASPALAAANGQVDGATRTWKRRGRDRATAGRLFVQALGPARDRGESSRRRWYHWDHRVPHRH